MLCFRGVTHRLPCAVWLLAKVGIQAEVDLMDALLREVQRQPFVSWICVGQGEPREHT